MSAASSEYMLLRVVVFLRLADELRLGHSRAFTTEIYAETDKRQAMAVMAKLG